MTSKTGVPLLFEISSPGRRGYRLPELDVPEVPVDELIHRVPPSAGSRTS